MPRTGTPKDNTPGSQCGAPASYTEFGPPDKTIPAGSYLRICSTVAVQGRMALNTCCSRIRRAINCVYCPPKSSTTMPPHSLIAAIRSQSSLRGTEDHICQPHNHVDQLIRHDDSL